MMMDIWDNNFSDKIQQHIRNVMTRIAVQIPLWDESVSKRIVDFIVKIFI
jgi:hypothetical protein